MLIFAIFTLGYFAGVITALAVFPPRVKEIEEQEFDALKQIIETKLASQKSSQATSFGIPVKISLSDIFKDRKKLVKVGLTN